MEAMLNQTLAEQLHITDVEIQNRKDILNFNKQDEALLSENKPFITSNIDAIVETFYRRQTEFPEISILIGDVETLRRLQSAMRRYIIDMFEGHYDADYVNRRLRIGKVHQRIGVSPKLYIAAIYHLQEVLNQTIDACLTKDGDNENAEKLKGALNRLLMFDTQLVFDTYISSLVKEVTAAKTELSQYAVSLENVIAERTEQLQELSRTDSLTGLYNQRAFYECLRHELCLAERYQEPISLCYFDLDGFKSLNDQYGHRAGDEILNMVGKAVAVSVRETDIGCRYGGDEFCVIFPRATAAEANEIMNRMVKAFAELTGNEDIYFSIGITETGPEEFVDVDTLVNKADKLMYASKEKSKFRDGFHMTVR